jgi:hypothetical protein
MASLSEMMGQHDAMQMTEISLLIGAPDFWYRLRALAAKRLPSWSPEKVYQVPSLLLKLSIWRMGSE